MSSPEKLGAVPEITLGPAAIERAVAEGEYTQTLFEAGAPLSPFHYQLRKVGKMADSDLTAGLACPIP
jgi:betaine lipid synthase